MSRAKSGGSIKLSLKLSSPSLGSAARSSSTSGTAPQKKRRLTSGEESVHLLPGTLESVISDLLSSLKSFSLDGRVLATPFLELPDKSLYPDYYQFIKKPVALNTIEENTPKYQTFSEFRSDVRTLVDNCRAYNAEGSEIYQDAEALLANFDKDVSKVRTSHKQALSAADEFFEAIEKGNIKTFTKILPLFPTVNFRHDVHLLDTDFQWAPLHAAAFHGQQKMVEMIADVNDADVEIQDTLFKGRALAWAAFGGHPKICKYLIDEKKADVKAKNIHDQTAADLVDSTLAMWKPIFFPETTVPPPVPSMTVKLTVKDLPPPEEKKRAIKEHKVRQSTGASVKSDSPRIPNEHGLITKLDFSKTRFENQSSSKLSSALNSPALSTPNGSMTPIQVETSSSSTSAYLPSASSSVGPLPSHLLPQRQQSAALSANSTLPPLEVLKDIFYPTVEGLLTSIGIVANDDAFKMVIPYSSADPEKGFSGHAITVSPAVKTINFRLMLNMSPFVIPPPETAPTSSTGAILRPQVRFQCTGFHTYNMTTAVPHPQSQQQPQAKNNPPRAQPNLPPTIVSQQFFEPITFKNAIPGTGPAGEIQDCSAMVHEGLNVFEMVVSAYLWLREANKVVVIHETHQSIGLMIHKMSR